MPEKRLYVVKFMGTYNDGWYYATHTGESRLIDYALRFASQEEAERFALRNSLANPTIIFKVVDVTPE